MLYTIVPLEAVFAPQEIDKDYVERSVDGQVIQMQRQTDGKHRITKLSATDLSMYLNKEYEPNRII